MGGIRTHNLMMICIPYDHGLGGPTEHHVLRRDGYHKPQGDANPYKTHFDITDQKTNTMMYI